MTARDLGLSLLLLAAPWLWCDRAAANPSPRPATGPNAELQEAIRVLTSEAEAFLKNGSSSLREKSNYFAPGQVSVSESELLDAMARRISRNSFVDAYVKWQLLSGLPTTISDGHLRLASRVYRSGPDLQRLPGAAPQDQQQMKQAILTAKESDISTINQMWRERTEPVSQVNAMVLRFRDAFSGRLPMSPETIELALADAVLRTEAGLETKKFVESLMARVRAWALEGAPPSQINRVSGLFGKLRDQAGATVLTSVEWDEKSKKVVWKQETRRVNPKYSSKSPDSDAFAAMAMELRGYARNTGGGLQLKRDK